MQTGFRMHGEGTVQQLMPRIVRLSGPCPRSDSLHGSFRTSKSPRELSAEEQQELRRKINSRERKRMQDLNVAMDALREVMIPYFSCPTGVAGALQHPYLPPGAGTGRRLSKISTLVLARNYILFLGSSLTEMRRLLGEVSIGVGVSGTVPSLLLTGGWPFLTSPGPLLRQPSEQHTKCPLVPQNTSPVQDEPSGWALGNMLDSSLCQCGVCQTRAAHVNPGIRFSK